MKNDKQTEYVVRDRILRLLSDGELASVSSAETASRLADGDEYLDLEQLEQGVRTAPVQKTPTSRMLPRKAVHQDTWNKILAVLATS
jgi:hypothetical protein